MYRQLCASLDRWLRIPPEPETPPGHSAVVFRAAPAFFRYRLLGWGLTKLPAVLVVGIANAVLLVVAVADDASRSEPAAWVMAGIGMAVLLGFGLFLGISLLGLRLDYEKRWYVLTDRSLRVREGVWTVREMTVTFANIQNIGIEQGPLQRWFGIADLKVDTAGGGGVAATPKGNQPLVHNLHSAWFRGVANAEAIKHLMQQRLHGMRDAGLGDTADGGAPAPAPAADLTTTLAPLLAEARALRRTAERAF